MKPSLYFVVWSFLLVGIIQSGCDPSFDPIQETDQHYSIFGYLNASADTQFVRIEKLRDSLGTTAAAHLDVEVTLTNTSTGQSAVLRDSVFTYAGGRAHNFYTTMDVEPNTSYHLEVEGPAGNTSVEVQIPDTFPKPQLYEPPDDPPFVIVRGVKRLVGAKIIYQSCMECECNPLTPASSCPPTPTINRKDFYYLPDTTSFSNGIIRVPIDSLDDRHEIGNGYPSSREFTITSYKMVVAAGTEQWPDYVHLDDQAVALPNVATNIQGGVGFLGGIVSDTLTIGTNPSTPCYQCPNQ